MPFNIVKVDQLQGVVYGWGNISVDHTGLVTDRQDDQWTPEELEKSVVDFMESNGDVGVMHVGKSVGRVVASLVTTPDIVKAFFGDVQGIPVGWLLGVKVDKSVLKSVVDGKLRAFSIQGSADRVPVDAD
jgi:hypothetical protein